MAFKRHEPLWDVNYGNFFLQADVHTGQIWQPLLLSNAERAKCVCDCEMWHWQMSFADPVWAHETFPAMY